LNRYPRPDLRVLLARRLKAKEKPETPDPNDVHRIPDSWAPKERIRHKVVPEISREVNYTSEELPPFELKSKHVVRPRDDRMSVTSISAPVGEMRVFKKRARDLGEPFSHWLRILMRREIENPTIQPEDFDKYKVPVK